MSSQTKGFVLGVAVGVMLTYAYNNRPTAAATTGRVA